MDARIGNQYYKLRTKDGREPQYSPIQLAEKANEYFEFCLENPLIEVDFKGKDADRVELPKMRAFSITGFCVFAEITTVTFYSYAKKNEYLNITTRIREIIENQQFEGAASGFLNPNIIARKLGLVDKKDITTKGESLSGLSTEELIARAKATKKVEQAG